MVYRIEAVILMEIGESTFRIANVNLNQNEGHLWIELDLIKEWKEVVVIRDVALKRKTTTRYNKKVISHTFEEEDLVFGVSGKSNHQGKLT